MIFYTHCEVLPHALQDDSVGIFKLLEMICRDVLLILPDHVPDLPPDPVLDLRVVHEALDQACMRCLTTFR